MVTGKQNSTKTIGKHEGLNTHKKNVCTAPDNQVAFVCQTWAWNQYAISERKQNKPF